MPGTAMQPAVHPPRTPRSRSTRGASTLARAPAPGARPWPRPRGQSTMKRVPPLGPGSMLLAALAACAAGASSCDAGSPTAEPSATAGAVPRPSSAARGPAPETLPGAAETAARSAPASPAPARPEGTPGAPERTLPRFRARTQWHLGAKPEYVVAGDVDGDGDEDLLAATQEGQLLVWRAGPEGLSRDFETIEVGGYPLEPLVLPPNDGGMFGDAIGPRVLTASRATPALDVWDLTQLPEAEIHAPLPWTPRALHARPTLLEGNFFAVAGDGGTWVDAESSVLFENRDALPRCARLLQDYSLAVGYQDTRSVHVVNTLGALRAILELDGIPRDLEEADLDGDGDLELIVAGGDDALWVFGWGRAGGIDAWLAEDGREPLTWRVGRIPIDVDAVDLDGDGRVELIVTNARGLSVDVLGDFTAESATRKWSGYVGQTSLSSCTLDVDGDGLRDLVVANRDAQALSVLRGLPEARFETATSIPVGGFPNELAVGDFDGDGRPDAIVLNAKSGTLTPLKNAGGAYDVLDPVALESSIRSPSLADADGDGRDELYVVLLQSSNRGLNLHALDYSSDGVFEMRGGWVHHSLGGGDLRVLVPEFRNDVAPDAIVISSNDPEQEPRGDVGHYPAVQEGSRTTFPGGVGFWETAFGPCDLATLQLDGDEDPEILVVGGGPAEPRGFTLFDRPGDEIYVEQLETVVTAQYPLDADCGDVDGDGREDVVLVCNDRWDGTDGFVQVFLRREGTAFETLPPVPTGLKPRHVAVGDLDGDGRADVVVAAQNSHVVNVWLARERDGATVLERQDDVGAGLGCLDVKLADVDGDGALDLLVANAFSDDVSVILVERR